MKCKPCTLCKTVSENSVKVGVWGQGESKSPVMIVNGYPDPKRWTNSPFKGEDYRFLKKFVFRAVGLEDEDIYFTHAIKCATVKKVNYSSALNCSKYLHQEVAKVKPRVVIAVGNMALNTIFKFKRPKDSSSGKEDTSGMSGIEQWRGRAYWHRKFNCWVVPTWGIDQIEHDRSKGFRYMQDQMENDFELAVRCIKRAKIKTSKAITELVVEPKQAVSVFKKMYLSDHFSEDLECDNLDFNPSNRILGVALCCEWDYGYYVDWLEVGEHPKVRKSFIKMNTAKENQFKIFHNGAYDTKMLAVHRLTSDGTVNPWKAVTNWHDTMIALYLLDENFSAGLKPWTWRGLDFGGYEETIDDLRRELKLKGFEGLEDYEEELTEYAALDAVATYRLWDYAVEKLKKYGLWNLYRSISLPVRKELAESELIGIYVDRKRALRLDSAIDQAIPLLYQSLKLHLPLKPGEEFNPKSNVQLQKMLFTRMGLKPLKKTKTGYSTDAESMEFVAKQKGGEAAQIILDIKYLDKMKGTFIKRVLESGEDSRIRTSFNTLGTVTGRASSPIHNFPNDYAIRSLFTVPKGRVLIHADLSAAEMRVLAAFSQDEALLRAFENGEDVHTATYQVMFGKSSDYIPTKPERSIAKTINFGLVYGRGPLSLSEQLGVPLNEAYRLLNTYFERLPKVTKFLEATVRMAHEKGYITNFFGRRRRLPDIHSDNSEKSSKAERQAKNSRIQGCSADYVNKSIGDIGKAKRKAGLDAKLILTVHDSVFYDTAAEDEQAMIDLLKTKLDRKLKVLPVQMKSDVEVEPAWSALEEDRESRLVEIFTRLGREYKINFLKGCLLPGILRVKEDK